MADNCLGNAAGCAEDDASARVLSKGIIRLGVGQICKIYAGLLYHPDELLRGEHEVNEPFAVLHKLGTRSLGFLGRAGHYCDRVQLIVGVVLPEDSAEHFHR